MVRETSKDKGQLINQELPKISHIINPTVIFLSVTCALNKKKAFGLKKNRGLQKIGQR